MYHFTKAVLLTDIWSIQYVNIVLVVADIVAPVLRGALRIVISCDSSWLSEHDTSRW